MRVFLKCIFIAVVLVSVSCSTSSNESENQKATNNEPAASSIVNPVEFGIDTAARIPQGLTVGNKAPGFAGRDNSGVSFDLYSNLKKGPVVLMFYRGKWCPVCNRYMSSFNDSVQYILNKGAQVVAVTPELGSNASEFVESTGTKFPVISDPTNTIMNAFDVTFQVTDDYAGKIIDNYNISIAENNGSETATLPIPATYIIDPTGTITFAHFDLNYRNRATVSQILKHLE